MTDASNLYRQAKTAQRSAEREGLKDVALAVAGIAHIIAVESGLELDERQGLGCRTPTMPAPNSPLHDSA
jgi:hypothetical protein